MDEINILEYVAVLRNRWRAVACVALASLVVCGIVLLTISPTYKGEAMLIFPLQKDSSLMGQLAQFAGAVTPSVGEYGSNPSLYTVILKSRTVNEAVLHKSGVPRKVVDYEDLQDRLSIQLSKDGGLLIGCEVPMSWLKGVPRSQREQRCAELSARMTNLYVRELQVFDRKNSYALGRDNREFIEGELSKAKLDLARAESRLQVFREQNPTVAPPEAMDREFEQVLGLKTEQIQAESGLREAQNQVETVRSAFKQQSMTIVASEVIAENPVVSALKQKLAEYEVHRSALLEKFTADHPDVVELDEQITQCRAKIKDEIARIVSSETRAVNPVRQQLEGQLVAAETARSGLEARSLAIASVMERVEKQLSALPAVQLRQMRLLRDVKAQETLYTLLLSEYTKSRITEKKEYKGFTVLDWAETPEKRSKPRVKLSLFIALLLGLTLGVTLAFVQEAVFRTTPKGRAMRDTDRTDVERERSPVP